MILWFVLLLLLGFGVLFRLGTKASRMGWLTWAIPAVLMGLLRINGLSESGSILFLFLLLFAAGALVCGVGLRLHQFCSACH